MKHRFNVIDPGRSHDKSSGLVVFPFRIENQDPLFKKCVDL